MDMREFCTSVKCSMGKGFGFGTALEIPHFKFDIYMCGKKKIAIVGTAGLPVKNGGIEIRAEQLVKQLGDVYDITVYCSAAAYTATNRKKNYGNARLKYLPIGAKGLQSIFYDGFSIFNALFFADIVLVHGVAGAWILPFVKIFTNKKIIISFDGIQWQKNKLSRPAKWYLKWAEKIAVKYSNADIWDNESILDYTTKRYGTLSNIIEYGANNSNTVKPAPADKEIYPFLAKPYAFKVCSIASENNIQLVLEAFSKINRYTLVIMGNWQSSQYGTSLYQQYKNFGNIILLDTVYDQHQLNLIRGNAYVYIHGQSAGGTNPSLVQAMQLGLPVIAFNASCNRATTENKAFYFSSPDDLTNIIKNTRIAELKEQGQLMKAIADRRYTWEVIAEKYNYLFCRVLKTHKKIVVKPAAKNLTGKKEELNELKLLPSNALSYEKR